MLVQEVPPSVHLFPVKVAAPLEMSPGCLLLSLNHLWVTLGLVQILQIGECSAHGAADEEVRILLVDEALGLTAHFGDVEIPQIPIIVQCRQVQSQAWDTPQV